MLVNPATSYQQSYWPILGPLLKQVPEELYGVLPYMLAPVFGNPLALLAHNLDFTATPDKQLGGLAEVRQTCVNPFRIFFQKE